MSQAVCPPARAADASAMRAPTGAPPVEWRVSDDLVPYEEAVAFMEARAAAIASGEARECVWLLEHPPIYTGGSSAKEQDLLEARFPVYRTGRGGQFTYHGPGQRVAYVMLDLTRRQRDVRAFVCALESWIIATLADFGVTGERRAGARRRLGRAAGEGQGTGRRNGGRQDRRHRRAAAAMGELPRDRAQCRAGSDAFFRHRALRRARRRILASRASRTSASRRTCVPSTPRCAGISRRFSARPRTS